MSFKRFFLAVFACTLMLTAAGCSQKDDVPDSAADTAAPTLEEMFTDRDRETSFDESTAVRITLADGASAASDGSVKISGDTLTITAEGEYVISGRLSNGQIIIDCDKTAKPHIILDGAEISCEASAPVYVRQADKAVITLNKGTQNTLTVTGEFKNIDDNNIDSAIFSKSDLTLNGEGSLTVSCDNGHGLVSKDDLAFVGGKYEINAGSHALDANDSIRVHGGEFSLTAGKDTLHAENTEDTSLGFVYLNSGTFTLNAEGDGIDASGYAYLEADKITVTSGGGSKNAEKKQENFSPFANSSAEETDTASTKGIKSGGKLTAADCTITADCADDAIHSNASVTFNSDLTAKTGDDAIHADADTIIDGGKIQITECYEGLEGQTVTVNGGKLNITASDDGLNAAGGNNQSGFGGFGKNDIFANDENSFITINGGKITIDAGGDGIDSNGSLTVTGGETYVWGPTNGGNGALDYAGDGVISGGIFVATGSQQMAMNFSEAQTQGAMLVSISGNGTVSLKDDGGKEILTFKPAKQYQCAVISCPEIVTGKTYTVSDSADSISVEMTESIYGKSNGFGGMGGGRGEMSKPDNFNGEMPSIPEDFNDEKPSMPEDFNGEIPTPPEGFGGRGGRMPNNQSDGKAADSQTA